MKCVTFFSATSLTSEYRAATTVTARGHTNLSTALKSKQALYVQEIIEGRNLKAVLKISFRVTPTVANYLTHQSLAPVKLFY